MKLGIAGRLTAAFIASPLTPLLLLASLALGLVALVTLPREEEPQISVPMVDILVRADGLKAEDAVKLVTEPLETIVKSIDGVEHVYSQTADDRAMVTARFLVGTSSDAAILRVHEKIRANLDRIPVGIPEPLIVGRGIDDVAIVVVTLSPKPEAAERWDAQRPDPARPRTAGRGRQAPRHRPHLHRRRAARGDPRRARSRAPVALRHHAAAARRPRSRAPTAPSWPARSATAAGRSTSSPARRCRDRPRSATSSSPPATAARSMCATSPTSSSSPTPHETRVAEVRKDGEAWQRVPAVSLAIAKRPGTNAVVIAEEIVAPRSRRSAAGIVPEDVTMTVTRNYGETANEKANELLFHLGLATISIVILVAVAIGWREAIVVAVVIPTTILLTLFAANVMGYTLNRVSLFALIFSIGILVDDAIVVIENIARHWAMEDGRPRMQRGDRRRRRGRQPDHRRDADRGRGAAADALRLGPDGPLHEPDPGERLRRDAVLLLRRRDADAVADAALRPAQGARPRPRHRSACSAASTSRSPGRSSRAARRAWIFLAVVGVLTVGSLGLFYTKDVTVKLLPFDNKTELQVVVDLPEGASVEDTDRVLQAAVDRLEDVPEIVSFQTYAGTAAPFNFNGLVRHYYLRACPNQGDVQVNLRRRASATARATTSRSRSASGSPASTCRRAPRSRWSSRRPGRRCSRRCSPRSTARMPRPAARSRRRCARPSRACPSSSTSTIPTAPRPSACGSSSTRTISNITASSRPTSTTRSRPSTAARRSAIRTAAAAASRSRSASASPRATASSTSGRWRRRCRPTRFPARRDVVELGDVVRVTASRPPTRSSATTAARPRW